MRGRIYTVPIAFTAQTAAIDLLELIAAATGIIGIRRLVIAQDTDFGDAEDEILELTIARAAGAYTSGSGGTTVTPEPVDQEGVAASFTAETHNTTQAAAGSGTLTTLIRDGWSVRAPYIWVPDDEEVPIAHPTDALVVSLPAPADSLDIGGTVWVEEIGT